MRFSIAAPASSFFLAALVKAECCDQTGGVRGYCDDGSTASPCCGTGSCSLFCCNCDGGYRQGSPNGCILLASYAEAACLGGSFLALEPEAIDACDAAYEVAVIACGGFSSKDKRSGSSPQAPSTCSDGIFERADLDKSSNITLAEYLAFVDWTTRGSVNDTRILTKWIAYYHSFDRGRDGVISAGEHERS